MIDLTEYIFNEKKNGSYSSHQTAEAEEATKAVATKKVTTVDEIRTT